MYTRDDQGICQNWGSWNSLHSFTLMLCPSTWRKQSETPSVWSEQVLQLIQQCLEYIFSLSLSALKITKLSNKGSIFSLPSRMTTLETLETLYIYQNMVVLHVYTYIYNMHQDNTLGKYPWAINRTSSLCAVTRAEGGGRGHRLGAYKVESVPCHLPSPFSTTIPVLYTFLLNL